MTPVVTVIGLLAFVVAMNWRFRIMTKRLEAKIEHAHKMQS